MVESAPEYNVTGHDYARREHFTHPHTDPGAAIVDIHSHVMLIRPDPSASDSTPGSLDQAEQMFDVATEFGVGTIVTMCPVDDIRPLRERFGKRIRFNGMINKKPDEPDDAADRNLDAYLEAGVSLVKLWAAPRGRERGLFLDAPWRVEALKRARAAGIRVVMAHVADPDHWFQTVYTDTKTFGTKAEQYVPLCRMLAEFSDMTWIAAHMGGDPEHPEHLAELLTEFPHLMIDTSATKWQVREVSPRREAIRELILAFPDRFLFGSDLVTRDLLVRDHYVSRYWCQRTLWESDWHGPSPIRDPDHDPQISPTPTLHGVGLPVDVVRQIYVENASRVLGDLDQA